MNFSSDTIELFLAVLDRGSFSGAARALGRVPSAVSMGIANLEAELGFALFEGRDHLAAPSRPAEAGAGAVPGRAGERAADPGRQLRPAVGRHPSADCRRLLAHRQPGHGAGNGRGGDRLGQFPVVPGRAAAGNGKAGTPGLQEYQERAETACPRYLAEKPAIAQGRPGTGWHAGHPSRLKRYAMHFTEKTRPVTRIAAHAGSPASST